MSISVPCSNCGYVNVVSNANANIQIECGKCNATLQLPLAEPLFDYEESGIHPAVGDRSPGRSSHLAIKLGITALVLLSLLLAGGLFYFANTFFGGVADWSPISDGDHPVSSVPNTTAGTDETQHNSIGMQFVLLPAVDFIYNQEFASQTVQPQPTTTLTEKLPAFYISRHEVTQAQFEKIMGTNPSVFRGADNPVDHVTFEQAMRFCRKLSEKEGANYRLPTDAEWEYACRAGTKTQFHYGNSLSSTQANFDGNWPYGGAPRGVSRKQTTPVGSFKPNAFGLYDMHGNVWEWCLDVADSGAGPGHVSRGGGGGSAAVYCRSGTRIIASGTNEFFGFRVVRTVPGEEGGESSPEALQTDKLIARISEEFAKERPKLPPGVLILPVVDEYDRCTGAGPVLSLTAQAAATYSAPGAGNKTMNISPGIVRLMYHMDNFLRRGQRISAEDIETMQACTGTMLYAMPRLIQRTDTPPAGPNKERIFQLIVAIRGGGPDQPDRNFVHELKELELLQIPAIIAIDVVKFLDVPFSADKLARLAEPPPADRSLGGLNKAGITSPRILLSYDKLSKDMAEMHNGGGTDGIRPGECGRCVGAWELFLISGEYVNGAYDQLQAITPPLQLDSLKVSIASNRIKRGRFQEAFEILMELAPTHRGDSAFHTVLMRLAVALGEQEFIDFVLQTWREQDDSYSGKLRRGQFLVDLAWDARGDGYAYQVSPEGFRLFRSRLEGAQVEFEQAIAANDRDWKARSHLITVAKGLGLPSNFLLHHFEYAVRAHPASANAYRATYDYLLPKWHGRHWELFSFGKMCTESGLWSDEIPSLLESAVTALIIHPETGEINRELLRDPAFRTALKSYLDESYRHRKQPQNVNVYYALWGALGGHYGDVAESFTPKMMQLTTRSVDVPRPTRLLLRDKVQSHTATGTVQTAARIRDGLAASRFDEVERLINEAAESELPHSELNRYRLALARGRRLFNEREVTFSPQELLKFWNLDGGTWSADDQYLVCDLSDYERITLTCPFGLGPAEVTGTWEWNDKVSSQAFVAPIQSTTVPVLFHIDPRRRAYWAVRNKVRLSYEAHSPGDSRFEFQSTQNNISFRSGKNNPLTSPIHDFIPGGFALQVRGSAGGQVRIGPIRIKLLDQSQPPVLTPEKTLPSVAQSKLNSHEIRRFGRPGVTIETFAFSPDRATLCVGFVDSVVELYDFASGKKLRELQRDQSYSPAAVGFTPDSRNVLIATHGAMMRMCNAETGKPSAEVYNSRSSFGTRLFDMQFLPDSVPQFLTAADDGVRLWKVEGVKLIKRFPFQDAAIHSLSCSSDGSRALFGRSDGSVQLIDLDSGNQLQRLKGHRGPVECVRFSPDGHFALSCARLDSNVRLWNLQTGTLVRTMKPHHGNIAALAFSSDGKRILTGGGQRNPDNQISRKQPDTSIQVWEADTGKQLRRFHGHDFGVTQIECLPDNKTAITAGGDGMIRLWNLTADE